MSVSHPEISDRRPRPVTMFGNMVGNERADDLSLTYRDADERLRVLNGYAVRKVRDAMSATPGWHAAAKAAAAHAVLVSNQHNIEAMVTTLFQAHIEAGERNPDAVAEQVRERFLSELTAPGLDFFEGSSAEAATLSTVAVKHAADFESWRDALAGDLVNRFRRVLTLF